MATETHELIVSMRPEGIEETESGLEGVNGQFDETADSVGDSAAEMEGFASKWQGAMSAVVAGLAIAAAGLLAQIPILGELFAGLGSILEAIAYQMDQVLRPVLQPLADAFFAVGAVVFELEGPLGTFIGILASVALAIGGAIAALAPFVGSVTAASSAVLGPLAGALTTLISVIGTVVAAIAGAVASIGLLPIAIAAAVAAALVGIYLFRDEIASALSAVVGFFADLASDAVSWVSTMASDVLDALADLTSDARKSGRELIGSFVSGIRSKLSAVRSAASDVVSAARNRLPFSPAKEGPLSDLDKSGPALVETFAKGIEGETGRVEAASDSMATGAAPGVGGTGSGLDSGLGGSRRGLRDEFERALESTDRTDDVVAAIEQLIRATRALGDEFDVDVTVEADDGRYDAF